MPILTALRNHERAVFVGGLLALLLLVAWPTIGALLVREMPIEMDDAVNSLVRAEYLLSCPRQDCRGPQMIWDELATKTGTPHIDRARAHQHILSFTMHTPLHSLMMAGLRRLGMDWLSAYGLFLVFGIPVIAVSIVLWLRAVFGEGPAGIGAVLVGTTYFVGHGLVWITPSTVTLCLGLLAAALPLTMGRRSAVWIVILGWVMAYLHVLGRGVSLLALLSYLVAVGPRWNRRDAWVVFGVVFAVASFTALPWIFARPDFRLGAVVDALDVSPLDVIVRNVMETVRITLRTTEIAGGLVPMLALGVLALIALPPARRRPAAAVSCAMGGLAVLSLFHISPHIYGELFARFWFPFAVTLTGAAAFLLWHALPIARVSREDLGILCNEPLDDRAKYLSADGWRIAAAVALGLICVGTLFHVAKGVYAIERARVMISGRQDFTFERTQPAMMLAQGCRNVWYQRSEVMHAYWLYGAINCGAIIPIGDDAALRIAPPGVSHAVAFNPMRFFQGWQPLVRSETFRIRSKIPLLAECGTAVDVSAPVAIHVKALSAGAALVVRGAGSERRIAIEPSPRWMDLGPLAAGAEIALAVSGGTAAIGGLRRGTPGTLAWPWDQGLEVQFVRDVPYQFRATVTENFQTAVHFPIGCVQMVDDHGMSALARVAASR